LAWTVEIEAAALKELKSLDHAARLSIHRFLKERIATDDDPRRFGEPLRKNLSGLWKYRVGAYRVICDIQDGRLVVLVVRVVRVGHRREVYGR